MISLRVCVPPNRKWKWNRPVSSPTSARNAITLAHQLEHRWFGLFGQDAISKCRAYDRSRAGVAYVTKCLTEGTWGANEYELRKFNLADTVTLSRSVFRMIRSVDRMGRDAVARTCKKRAFDEWATASETSARLETSRGKLRP